MNGRCVVSDSPFDPDELESIAQRFSEIIANEDEGYEMVFYISQNDAEDLLENYHNARRGIPSAIQRCWYEYSKIMEHLDVAVEENNDESS